MVPLGNSIFELIYPRKGLFKAKSDPITTASVETFVRSCLKGQNFRRRRRNPRKGLLKGVILTTREAFLSDCFLTERLSFQNSFPVVITFHSK